MRIDLSQLDLFHDCKGWLSRLAGVRDEEYEPEPVWVRDCAEAPAVLVGATIREVCA